MVGLGTLVYAISRALWRSRDYWIAIGLAAFISIGLTVPFFLALPLLCRANRASPARSTMRGSIAANLGAWAASAAWAHRWWLPALGDFNEVLFPGLLTR